MTSSPPIGFIGLGAIGTPIFEALADSGLEIAIHDVDHEAVARAAAGRSVIVSASPAEVADRGETVFVSLPTPDVVRAVALERDGIVEGRAVRTYVDLSTTGVAVARDVAATLGETGIDVLDAPVSGGVAGARSRTLAVMAAGAQPTFQRVRPLLETFGSRVFLVGHTPGQGQLAKLLNNLLSASALAITSEALALGVTAGLAPETLLDVFNAGTGRNTATTTKFPEQILTHEFASGFRLELMAKDVALCLAEARARDIPMPVGGVIEQLWRAAAEALEADADHTEIVGFVERATGVEIAGGKAGRVEPV